MGFFQTFLPKEDRFAALMLYGMVFSTCFNGYDAGIMTVILADRQFIDYYDVDSTRSGVIATIPWASTGKCQCHLLSRAPSLHHVLVQKVFTCPTICLSKNYMFLALIGST